MKPLFVVELVIEVGRWSRKVERCKGNEEDSNGLKGVVGIFVQAASNVVPC